MQWLAMADDHFYVLVHAQQDLDLDGLSESAPGLAPVPGGLAVLAGCHTGPVLVDVHVSAHEPELRASRDWDSIGEIALEITSQRLGSPGRAELRLPHTGAWRVRCYRAGTLTAMAFDVLEEPLEHHVLEWWPAGHSSTPRTIKALPQPAPAPGPSAAAERALLALSSLRRQEPDPEPAPPLTYVVVDLPLAHGDYGRLLELMQTPWFWFANGAGRRESQFSTWLGQEVLMRGELLTRSPTSFTLVWTLQEHETQRLIAGPATTEFSAACTDTTLHLEVRFIAPSNTDSRLRALWTFWLDILGHRIASDELEEWPW